MAKNNTSNYPLLQKTNVAKKTCLVRLDLNVPIKDGKITDTSRIVACEPTINYLLDNKAKLVILSHLSRVKTAEDITSGKKSLAIVAKALQQRYPKMKIIFVKNNTDKKLPSIVKKQKYNEIILLENTRYNDFDLKKKEVVKKESKCDPKLAKFWASLGQVYVNDAFATIHRKHASNYGIASNIKTKCVGFLIQHEMENIQKFNAESPKPIISIVGGAKITDKIVLLEKLMQMSDLVLIGGGMSFTFLKALGYETGLSLCDTEMLETAKNLYMKYKDKILLPVDFLATTEYANHAARKIKIKKFPKDLMGLDIGPKTTKLFTKAIKKAQTIFWNGPTGAFELENYSISTKAIADAIADATKCGSFSLIGGGDTAAAAIKFADKTSFSFVSTGGGATLSVIQGDELPGLIF